MNKILEPVIALGMVAAPVSASADELTRAAEPASSESDFAGAGAAGVPIIAGLLLVLGTYFLADNMDDSDEDPISV